MVFSWRNAKKQNRPLREHPRAFLMGCRFWNMFLRSGPFAGVGCFEMPIAELDFNKTPTNFESQGGPTKKFGRRAYTLPLATIALSQATKSKLGFFWIRFFERWERKREEIANSYFDFAYCVCRHSANRLPNAFGDFWKMLFHFTQSFFWRRVWQKLIGWQPAQCLIYLYIR